MRRCWLLLWIWLSPIAWADEVVPICHGYGCMAQEHVRFNEAGLSALGNQLLSAVDAEKEREILSVAIGQLYAWAGEVSDIRNDRGGNFADDYKPGKMDCIDHSTSTTRLLKMLDARGYLRWHRVGEIDVRRRIFVVIEHYSAVIEEKSDGVPVRFVVDSWFVDNGEPAVILPLDEWKKGAGPDV